MRELSADDHAAIVSFVRSALPVMGLAGWVVSVSRKPSRDYKKDDARIDPDDYSNSALLSLGSGFDAADDDEGARILVHELAHLYVYRTTQYVETLKGLAPAPLWTHFWDELERKEDIAVEDLARVCLKLPGMPKLRRKRKR